MRSFWIDFLTVKVPANVPLETYETILNRELPGIGERDKRILGIPAYIGVDEISAYYLSLLVMAECREQDYFDVKYYVNREIWLALEKEGIRLTYFPVNPVSPDKNQQK